MLDHSLLIQHKEGRYRFHDLLRAYARTRVAREDAAATQLAAMKRIDKAATKGVIHKNAAARRKSRLAKKANKAAAAAE